MIFNYSHLFFVCCVTCLTSIIAAFFPSGSGGIIAAFGDFNNDKWIDVVVINNDQKSLTIYYTVLSSTASSASSRRGPTLTVNSSIISGVVPGDFNGDSSLDLAVYLKDSSSSNTVNLGIFFHSTKKPDKFDDFIQFNLDLDGQPVVCDSDGDQISDFLAFSNGTVSKLSGFARDSTNVTITKNFFPAKDVAGWRTDFAHVFGQAVGDKQPDFIIGLKDGLQVYRGYFGSYTKSYKIAYPPGGKVFGHPTIVDMDMDSVMDLALPVCADIDCASSQIYYRSMDSVENYWKLFHSFKEQADAFGSTNLRFSSSFKYPGISKLPFLHAGDVNFDGYPDFVVTMSTTTKESSELFLLVNTPCVGSNSQICNGERGLVWSRLGIENVEVATIYDFNHNGDNDLMYSTSHNDKFDVHTRILAEVDKKSFLKVMAIGGLCGPNEGTCLFGRKRENFGANLPGATMNYEANDAEGTWQRSIATQLAQASYFALQTPYVNFGLSNMPNYVNKLTITLATIKGSKLGTSSLESVIPNSMPVLIPNPPDKPGEWVWELLLTLSDIVWKLATAFFGLVVLLGFIVLVLQYQEKREDDAEKRQEAHKFHFDAM